MTNNTPAPADLVEAIVAIFDENVSNPHLHGDPDLKRAHEQDKRKAAAQIITAMRASAVGKGDGFPSLELCVQFSECGQHIRKWSRLPFDGGTDFYSCPVAPQPDLRDAVVKELRGALAKIADGMVVLGQLPDFGLVQQFARTALANSEGK